MSASLRSRLEEGLDNDLGSLSVVVMEVLSLLGRCNVDLYAVEQCIGKDPGLAARILRIANSPFCGVTTEIATIKEATVALGVNTIRNIVTTAGVMALFSDHGDGGFDRLAFWQHAIGTAVASRVVASHSGQEAETGFTAGLLHDVGKLVIHTVLPAEFNHARQIAREQGCLLREAEQELLGFDHACAGGLALERWGLPRGLSLAVRDHHRPGETEEAVAAVVHVGDILCRSLDIGDGGDALIPVLDPDAWECLQLDWDDISQCLGEIDQLNAHANLFL